MPTRPKSAQKGVAGRRPRSGKTSLPRVAGACAGSPAQSSYVQPSDVRIEAVEGLRDQVAFSREFEKIALQQQDRSQTGDLNEQNQRALARQLEATKRKEAKLAAKNRQLQEQLEQLKAGPGTADEKLARERLRVQNLQQNVAALKTERSGLVREARDAEEARAEAEAQLEGLRGSLDRAVGERAQLEKQLAREAKKLKAEQQNSRRLAMEHEAIVRTLAVHKEEKSAVAGAKSAIEEQWEADRERHRQEVSELVRKLDSAQAETAALQLEYDELSTRYLVLKNRETKRKSLVRCDMGVQADVPQPEMPPAAKVDSDTDGVRDDGSLRAALAEKAQLVAQTAAVAAAAAAPQSAPRASRRKPSSLPVIRPSSPIWWAAESTSGPSPRALRSVFDSFDADNSGTIDSSELQKIFSQFGHSLSNVEVRAMLEVADADGSGEIDFAEFQSIVASNLRNELWYSAAKMVAVDAATKIQKAFAQKWPHCSRLTMSASAKLSSIAAQALKKHTAAVTAAGAAAAAAQGKAIDRRLEAINSKAQDLQARPVTRSDETKAATKIQAVFRGKRGRRQAKCVRRECKRKQEDAAASKIQAVFRGRKVRTNRATMLRQKKMKKKKRREEESAASRGDLRSRQSDAGKENRVSRGNTPSNAADSDAVKAHRPLSREDWLQSTDPNASRDRLRAALMDSVLSSERTVLGRTGTQKPTPDQVVLAKIEAFRLRQAKLAEKRRASAQQQGVETGPAEQATAATVGVK